MTEQELDTLDDIASEVGFLRDRIQRLMEQTFELYQREGDMKDRESHTTLTKATTSMQEAVLQLARANREMRYAYMAEMDLMDF